MRMCVGTVYSLYCARGAWHSRRSRCAKAVAFRQKSQLMRMRLTLPLRAGTAKGCTAMTLASGGVSGLHSHANVRHGDRGMSDCVCDVAGTEPLARWRTRNERSWSTRDHTVRGPRITVHGGEQDARHGTAKGIAAPRRLLRETSQAAVGFAPKRATVAVKLRVSLWRSCPGWSHKTHPPSENKAARGRGLVSLPSVVGNSSVFHHVGAKCVPGACTQPTASSRACVRAPAPQWLTQIPTRRLRAERGAVVVISPRAEGTRYPLS